MIEITAVQKSFGELKVLEDINLRIEDGDIYGLVGKSGAGKSTLLRCLNGLETYDSGSIRVNGTEVKELDKPGLRLFRKDIAMIFQHFPLMSRKTVYDNIAFPMRCWKYDKQQIDSRVRELAEIVGITDKLKMKPNVLSGGQKQRVAIARALSMKPQVLLSDESTSALDPGTTASILRLLRRINEELGITIIVVTHQMSVIRELCRNVSLLEKGRLVLSGPVNELFLSQPDALRRFMLEDDIPPDPRGEELQIMLTGDDNSQTILSRLARELQVSYSVAGGKIERYRDQQLGSLVLTFAPEDISRVCAYLDAQGIVWHRYLPLESGKLQEEEADA